MEVVLKETVEMGKKCDVFRNSNYHIKGEETGGARGTWTREEKCIQNKLDRETRGKETTCETSA
jgi:hypothetical protein